ncbi:MAG TPA: DUF456 domain-containing protein [Phycisphaerae bacterium]|nr:DUF456 domain-containing protein [Phycisphaerae bacterium]
MLDLTLYTLVLLLSLAGILLNILSLPGNWLIPLLALGLSWRTNWHHPTPAILAAIVAVLTLAELIELAGSLLGAKTFGASKSATWAAIAGAITGALIGSPLALLGGIVGAILGAFLAAWLTELIKQRPHKQALKSALGAALGRATGLFIKISFGLATWLALALFAWPR